MTDQDRSDLEEAIRLLRGWGGRHFAPYVEAETRDFLARHPEKPKLLPCAHCGSRAASAVRAWRVICSGCGAQTSAWPTEAGAAAAWNRRATPASGPLSGGKPE